MMRAVDAEPPARIAAFWSAFLDHTGRPPATPLFEAFAFGDHEALADALADLVRRGRKTATASLVWEYETEGKRAPRPGDLSVVTSGDGRPLCVIETTDVEVHAFEDVDPQFAAAEGEGDGSLDWWRQAHWSYFGRVCARLGRERAMRMPVVCERFRVVFAADENGG
jgi:uncharacterized protein YhfF